MHGMPQCQLCNRLKRACDFVESPDTCQACQRKSEKLRCHGYEKQVARCDFNKVDLRTEKVGPPFCWSCNARVGLVQRRLKERKAWRCTCGGPVHSDKCDLPPTQAHERRWCGKNVDVSDVDAQLWTKRRKKQDSGGESLDG